jgi:hypothetical protein
MLLARGEEQGGGDKGLLHRVQAPQVSISTIAWIIWVLAST